ncbi:hypothetical protein FBQ97_04535 [Acidobacteria bacterium ACD]|nr:hypothetical protein [Acidobacteria bacterium ACD]
MAGRGRSRGLVLAALLGLLVLPLPVAAQEAEAPPEAPFDGLWGLNEKASRDVPESAKGVDLKIAIKGNQFIMQRLVMGKPVGDAFALMLDGKTREMELGGGKRAMVDGRWAKEHWVIEQNVRMLTSTGPGLPPVQRTVNTVSPDGQTLTRVQTTHHFGRSEERVLVYRRKPS